MTVAGEVATKSTKINRFAPGDNVEVTEGELTHLQGRVISVDGGKVTMIPKHEELQVLDDNEKFFGCSEILTRYNSITQRSCFVVTYSFLTNIS